MKKKEIKDTLNAAMGWIYRLLVDPEETRTEHMDELMTFWNDTIDKYFKEEQFPNSVYRREK